jgi:hypothetical protein
MYIINIQRNIRVNVYNIYKKYVHDTRAKSKPNKQTNKQTNKQIVQKIDR